MISSRVPANAAKLPTSAPSKGKKGSPLKPKFLLKFKTSKEDKGVILTGLFEKVYPDGSKSFQGKNRESETKYGVFINAAKDDKPEQTVLKVQQGEGKWSTVCQLSLKNGPYGSFMVGEGSFDGVQGSFFINEKKAD